MNKIVHCDCVDGMRGIRAGSIPLVVSSPPYDGIYIWGGHPWSFDKFKEVAEQLWRVVAPGGVVCWQIEDQSKNGSHSGTKYKHVLHFMSLGFRLFEELFIATPSMYFPVGRHPEQVNMVFVLTKGKPRCVNVIKDRLNVTAGQQARDCVNADPDGTKRVNRKLPGLIVPPIGKRTHLWKVISSGGNTTDDDAYEFKGLMPDKLAGDLIRTYSRPGDTVLDCFSGAGTTAKMAMLNFRSYLGFEIWDWAYELSLKRLAKAKQKQRRLASDFFTV